jgi:hypothetical protein
MSETYGTGWVETARDKVRALLAALPVDMAGTDPTIGYIYDGHVTANLQLNAVSISLESYALESQAAVPGAGPVPRHDISFTVRVHTGYLDDPLDDIAVQRLLNSVQNKLLANQDLGDNYYIMDTTVGEVTGRFEDSGTVGGELTVNVWTYVTHTQE